MTLGRAASLTDTGRKRRRNEDAYVVQPPLFAVADGMGGAQAGELASRLAAEALRDDGGAGSGEERVASLIQEANRRVYERSSEDSAVSGMGTTMTVALVEEREVVLGHVGDSRAYRLRDGRLQQLTEDHSLVAELMRDGKLSPEEAETHPQRSVITRALGTDPDVDVDIGRVDARPGDVFLLCSDGLTSMVGDEAILRIVEEHRDDLQAAARALVQTANRSGGEDNITVIFFEIAEDAAAVDDTRTLAMPSAAAAGSSAEDEDTLSELDRVPAVDTMVVPPAEARERFAVPPPVPETPAAAAPSSRLARWALLALAIVAVTAVLLAIATWALLR